MDCGTSTLSEPIGSRTESKPHESSMDKVLGARKQLGGDEVTGMYGMSVARESMSWWPVLSTVTDEFEMILLFANIALSTGIVTRIPKTNKTSTRCFQGVNDKPLCCLVRSHIDDRDAARLAIEVVQARHRLWLMTSACDGRVCVGFHQRRLKVENDWN